MCADNMMPQSVELLEAEKFLKILDPGQKDFTFQTFDDAKQGRPLTKVLHGSLAEHWEELCRLNWEGAGIFATVNATDLKGREKKNIVSIRAIWMEDDGGAGKDLLCTPHMTVKTSPGKYHKYMLTQSTAVDEFDPVQARMDEYGSDPNAKGINRVLRVPGFNHMKDPDNPHMVKLVQESGQPPVPWDLIKLFYPPVVTADATTTVVWTTEPVPEYTPFLSDEELIRKAKESRGSAQAFFSDGVTCKQLWDRDDEALSKAYPHETNPYDASRADAALTTMLMFWTGKNCEHVERLMRTSGLVRDKWKKHKTYLRRTIQKCYSHCDNVYGASIQKAAVEPADWPDPIPVKTELRPVPPLSEDLLPNSLREWVFDIADRMKVPPEYVAVAVLVVASSLIGTSCRVAPKKEDDWKVTPNLWGAVIGYPSDGKSPSLEEVLSNVVSRLEREADKIFAEEMKVYEVDDLVQDETKKLKKKKIQEALKKGADVESLKSDLVSMPDEEPPKKRRFRTNNASIEKLGEIQSENPRGILIFRDELVGAIKKWDENGDRPFYLESWTGSSSFIDDKIGRGTTYVEKHCLSILGTIQPDRITSYLVGAITGFDNDGFVQRFQLMVFPDRVPWAYVDRKPNRAAKDKVFDIYRKIAYGAFFMEDDNDYSLFNFDTATQEMFKEWFTDLHENKIHDTDDHAVLTEHFGKYRSLMPSLALIFHLVEEAPNAIESTSGRTPSFHFPASCNTISVGSVGKAIAWCEFLEAHARRIYGMATDAGVRAAAILAEKIGAGKLEDGFTRRIVSQKGWKLLTDNQIIDDAIEMLIDCSWLRRVDTEISTQKHGRPPLPQYEINPKCVQK